MRRLLKQLSPIAASFSPWPPRHRHGSESVQVSLHASLNVEHQFVYYVFSCSSAVEHWLGQARFDRLSYSILPYTLPIPLPWTAVAAQSGVVY